VYNCAVDDYQVKRPRISLADDPEYLHDMLDRAPSRPFASNADQLQAAPPAPAETLPRFITAPFESMTAPGLPGEKTTGHGPRPLLQLFPSDEKHLERSAIRTRPSSPLMPPQPEPPAVAPPPPEIRETPRVNVVDDTAASAFASSSDPRFFYHSTPHDEVSQQLLTAIRRHEGLVVLTAPFGAGKTTLCRTVVEQLDRRTLTSLITDPFVSGEELLKQILADFGVMSHDELARGPLATRHELSTTLQAFVESLAPLEASAVVIVDEAHNLPPDVFDEVRMLCEAADTSAPLQVILVGQPELTERLRRPENKALHARVAVRSTLDPLPPDEIADYVAYRLAIAGTDAGITFDAPALGRIFALTAGIPRVVNLVCERALARAHEASTTVVSQSIVDAAAEDLNLSVAGPDAGLLTRLAGAVLLMLLVLTGAAAAAWVFRDAAGRAVDQWRNPAATDTR